MVKNEEPRVQGAHSQGRSLAVWPREENRFSGRSCARSGRGAPGLLLGVLVAGLLGGWLLWQIAGERPGEAPMDEERGEALAPLEAPEEELAPPPRRPSVPGPAPDEPVPTAAPRPSRLSVRVRDAGNGFIGEARVEVRDATGARVATLALTAASPRAELECAAGEYELVLAPPAAPALGALPKRIALEPGASETVEFALVSLWRLAGRLADGRELGIEDVRVALEREQRTVSEARTLSDGRFAFPLLPEGDYALVLGDPLGPLVPRRILRLDGELGELELRVPVLLELEVRVLDEHGLAVAGAEVEGAGEKGGRVAGVTDADGRLRAAQLPPGNYRIYARHATLGRGNRIFVLSAPTAAPLEIRLLSGAPER